MHYSFGPRNDFAINSSTEGSHLHYYYHFYIIWVWCRLCFIITSKYPPLRGAYVLIFAKLRRIHGFPLLIPFFLSHLRFSHSSQLTDSLLLLCLSLQPRPPPTTSFLCPFCVFSFTSSLKKLYQSAFSHFIFYYYFFYWWASGASETLSRVTQLKIGGGNTVKNWGYLFVGKRARQY